MIAKTFEGDRLNLHVPGKEDYRFIHECVNTQDHRRMMTTSEPIEYEKSRSIRQMIANMLSRRLEMKKEGLLLIAEADGERVGVCGLQSIDYQNSHANIFVCVREGLESLGYGYEMNKEIINFGFNELGLNKIKAGHRRDNENSKTMAEEVGLERKCIREQECYVDGEYRDIVMYEILREEWNRSQEKI